MLGDFPNDDTLDFCGCSIHLVPRDMSPGAGLVEKAARWLRLAVADQIALYRAAVRIGEITPPQVVYALREGPVPAAWVLGRRYKCVTVKRFFGTFFYDWWFLDGRLRKRFECLKGFVRWLWPADLLIITDDGTNGARIADFLHLDKRKYRVWLNGVYKDWSSSNHDPDAVKASLGLPQDSFVILSLARLTKWKRHDRAIRAMPAIRESIPAAELIIAGDGPLRPELETLATQLGIQRVVHFVGKVQHSDVRSVMAATDVLVVPYDLTCLCSTLLEGLVCGKAIVAWDIGTTRNVLFDNVNGRLLPNAEPQTIADAVVSLATSPAERAFLENGARCFAQERLQSWDERCDMEIDLVETIAARMTETYPGNI